MSEMNYNVIIIPIIFLLLSVSSCTHKDNMEATDKSESETVVNQHDSDIHKIVRYAISEWDSIFLNNDIDIISVETLSSDTFHWTCVYAIPCYRSFLDTIPGLYPIRYTIIEKKLIRLILDEYMMGRNKHDLSFINPCDYPKYKLCEGGFSYDPTVYFFCVINDSLVFRHKGPFLPDSIRHHPYRLS